MNFVHPLKIVNGPKLLAQIATGIRELERDTPRVGLTNIEVVLYGSGTRITAMSLGMALDYITSDVFHDTEADWSEADRAEVRVM